MIKIKCPYFKKRKDIKIDTKLFIKDYPMLSTGLFELLRNDNLEYLYTKNNLFINDLKDLDNPDRLEDNFSLIFGEGIKKNFIIENNNKSILKIGISNMYGSFEYLTVNKSFKQEISKLNVKYPIKLSILRKEKNNGTLKNIPMLIGYDVKMTKKVYNRFINNLNLDEFEKEMKIFIMERKLGKI